MQNSGRLRKPPGMSLATCESFSGLQLREGMYLYCAQVDLENCFHNLRTAEHFKQLVDSSVCLPFWHSSLVLQWFRVKSFG
eukprot:1475118-Amphidinium_carterae.3